MQIQTFKVFSWKLRNWDDDMDDETLFFKFPVSLLLQKVESFKGHIANETFFYNKWLIMNTLQVFRLIPLHSNKNVGRITRKRSYLQVEIGCVLVSLTKFLKYKLFIWGGGER